MNTFSHANEKWDKLPYMVQGSVQFLEVKVAYVLVAGPPTADGPTVAMACLSFWARGHLGPWLGSQG